MSFIEQLLYDQTQGSDEYHTQKLDHLFDQDVQFYWEREQNAVGKVVTFLYLSHVKIEKCHENIAEAG